MEDALRQQQMNVRTRPVRRDEKAWVWTLYASALRPHIELIWGWDEAWQLADFDRAFDGAATYIIEADGACAGYIQLDFGAAGIHLRMLILAPAFQSKGLGATLLKELLRISGETGHALSLRVFRTNGAAKRFYEREGWCAAEDQGDFFLMQHAQARGARATALARAPSAADFELAIALADTP